MTRCATTLGDTRAGGSLVLSKLLSGLLFVMHCATSLGGNPSRGSMVLSSCFLDKVCVQRIVQRLWEGFLLGAGWTFSAASWKVIHDALLMQSSSGFLRILQQSEGSTSICLLASGWCCQN